MNRITVLKDTGSKTDHQFASFAKVEFPSVFRTSPLPAGVSPARGGMSSDDLGQLTLQNWNNGPLISESSNPKKSLESPSLTNGHPASPRPTNNVHSPSSPQVMSNGHSSDLHQLNANGGASTPTPSLPTAWTANQKIVLLNVNDERVDANLGPIDAAAAARVAERCEKTKLCNDFHLRDKCRTAGCTFAHEPRLDPKEMVVLRYKARFLICERGSSCRIADCWHGHLCPIRSCAKPTTCRFKDFHHVDKTAVTVWRGPEPRRSGGV